MVSVLLFVAFNTIWCILTKLIAYSVLPDEFSDINLNLLPLPLQFMRMW